MTVVSIERYAPTSYTVRGDGTHACGLTQDEALGTIASWLYTGKHQFRMYDDGDGEHQCFAAEQADDEARA